MQGGPGAGPCIRTSTEQPSLQIPSRQKSPALPPHLLPPPPEPAPSGHPLLPWQQPSGAVNGVPAWLPWVRNGPDSRGAVLGRCWQTPCFGNLATWDAPSQSSQGTSEGQSDPDVSHGLGTMAGPPPWCPDGLCPPSARRSSPTRILTNSALSVSEASPWAWSASPSPHLTPPCGHRPACSSHASKSPCFST